MGGAKWKINLVENQIYSPDCQLFVADAKGKLKEVPFTRAINTYAGYLNDDPKQWVRFFVSDTYFAAMIPEGDDVTYIESTFFKKLKILNHSNVSGFFFVY